MATIRRTSSPSDQEQSDASPRKASSTTTTPRSDASLAATCSNLLGVSSKTFVMYVTHLNIVLYALAYWIQIGVLPVSLLEVHFEGRQTAPVKKSKKK